MRRDYFIALARSLGDYDRCQSIILQAAASTRDSSVREELRRLAAAPMKAPADLAGLCYELNPAAAEQLVLGSSARQQLEQVAREHAARGALLERGLQPRRRLLFHGPPGNGKTMAAAVLCAQIGLPAWGVVAAQVVEGFLGATGRHIERVLGALDAGCALVIDEIDTLGQARGQGHDQSSREQNAMVNAMLSRLDRVSGGLLIATTNRADLLDAALRRRFDLELSFEAPDEASASKLWDMLLRRYRLPASKLPAEAHKSFAAITQCAEQMARDAALQEHDASCQEAS